ncbi:MAG: ATP-dependent DNA helicase RecG [Bacteroidetes bacterium]|nr:ATP-dependent DNA helicase RecG [Bacteroidota bacterium]
MLFNGKKRELTEHNTILPEHVDVSRLPGVGPGRARVLQQSGIHTAWDLLYYFPRRYLDRSTIVPIRQLTLHAGAVVTVVGSVGNVATVHARRKRIVVTLRDNHASMELVFFQGLSYWQQAFRVGEHIAVSGEVQQYGRKISMVHPDIDRLQDDETLSFINTGGIVPVYPSNAELEKVGLNRHGGFRRLMHDVLQLHVAGLRDWYPSTLLENEGLIPLQQAIRHIHTPPDNEALNLAKERLIFDEFFILSLQLALRKRMQSGTLPGISFAGESPTARDLVHRLPFELTAAQKRVLHEIVGDMRRPQPMNRLLQGDVGSGKTVVALLAMLLAVDNGYQCALMVPTEILAEQHFRTITGLIDDLRVNVRLLLGQQSNTKKQELAASIANGDVHIVIGTHALIQQHVQFHRLGLIVIDEQHRFGVMQRADLRQKNAASDMLIMTATPIPRTLSMTLYGDLDVSLIDELPANRRRVKTAIRFEEDRDRVHDFLREEVAAGNQAYIVFPLISESEKMDLKAATEEYERLHAEVFPDLRLGLLHGRLKAEEKDRIMMAFKNRKIDILVSTTVIEVGVDVPDATVMVIEHAERFGLAQLHQLRGRVGRSDKQAFCILMTAKRLYFAGKARTNEEQKELSDLRRRLDTMYESTDGFHIAEVDMEIRGPGDLWGTQQSGYPLFRIANLLTHGHILTRARDHAFSIIQADPQLRMPEHERIREILGPRIREQIGLSTVS